MADHLTEGSKDDRGSATVILALSNTKGIALKAKEEIDATH
jgi:hypothetical protein